MQVCHIFIATAPGRDLLTHGLYGVFGASPHTSIHHDAVVHVVPHDVYRVLGLYPLFHRNPLIMIIIMMILRADFE